MSLIDRCRERCQHSEEDEGFTLIELLVVLLIIGILLAIAIPTFLSVTKGANGTAAQSNLQTALTGGDTFFTDNNQSYSGIITGTANASSLSQIDTGLTYTTKPSTATNVISYAVNSTDWDSIVFAAFAPGQNTCWAVADVKATGSEPGGITNLPGGTKVAVGTYYGKAVGSAKTGCSSALTYTWSAKSFASA